MLENSHFHSVFEHYAGQIEEAAACLDGSNLDDVFARLNGSDMVYEDVIPLWIDLSAKRNGYNAFQESFDSHNGYFQDAINEDGTDDQKRLFEGSLHKKFNNSLDYGARLDDALNRVRDLYEKLADPQEFFLASKLEQLSRNAVDANMVDYIQYKLSDQEDEQRQYYHDAIIAAYPDMDFSEHFSSSNSAVETPEHLVSSIDELMADLQNMREGYVRFGGFTPEAGKSLNNDVIRAAVAQQLYAQNCFDFDYLGAGQSTFVVNDLTNDRIVKITSFDCDPFPELSQDKDIKPYVFPNILHEAVGDLGTEYYDDKAIVTIMPRGLPLEQLRTLDGDIDDHRISVAAQIYREIADNIGLDYDIGNQAVMYEERSGQPLYDGNNLLALLDADGNLVEKDIVWEGKTLKVPVVYLGDADGISQKPALDNGAVERYRDLYFDASGLPVFEGVLNQGHGAKPPETADNLALAL